MRVALIILSVIGLVGHPKTCSGDKGMSVARVLTHEHMGAHPGDSHEEHHGLHIRSSLPKKNLSFTDDDKQRLLGLIIGKEMKKMADSSESENIETQIPRNIDDSSIEDKNPQEEKSADREHSVEDKNPQEENSANTEDKPTKKNHKKENPENPKKYNFFVTLRQGFGKVMMNVLRFMEQFFTDASRPTTWIKKQLFKEEKSDDKSAKFDELIRRLEWLKALKKENDKLIQREILAEQYQ